MRADPNRLRDQTTRTLTEINSTVNLDLRHSILLLRIYERLGDVILEISALSDLIDTGFR